MKIQIGSWMRCIALALLAVVMTAEVASAQSPWRWKFATGETLQYDIEQQSQTETKGAGKPTSATIKMSMRLTWKIEKVNEQGAATVIQTIDRISTSMQVDKLEPVAFDSATQSTPTGAAKEVGESLKPIIGAPFTVQLSGRGEVITVEPAEAVRDVFGKLKSHWFSGDALLRITQQASFVLPEQPVTPGATWESTRETPSPLGTLNQKTRYTYVGPAERQGKSYEKVDSDTELKLLKANDASASVSIQESEQRGSLWFDPMRGRLIASELKQRLVTERPYREMIIRVQSTTTSTSTLVEN